MEVHLLVRLCQLLTATEGQIPYCTPGKSRITFTFIKCLTRVFAWRKICEGLTLMARSSMVGALSLTSSSWIIRVPVPVAGTSSDPVTVTVQLRHLQEGARSLDIRQLPTVVISTDERSVFIVFDKGRLSVHLIFQLNHTRVFVHI